MLRHTAPHRFPARRIAAWTLVGVLGFLVVAMMPEEVDAASPARTAANLLVGLHTGEVGVTADSAGVVECAEGAFHSGRGFSAITTDRSDSLDRLFERHRVRNVRAVFRRADGSPLAHQSRDLARRLARAGGRHARSAARSNGASESEIERQAALLAQVYRLELPAEADLTEALDTLRADPHVAFAQIDHPYVLDFMPNDPFLFSAGSWSQDFADLWALDRIRAREAWDLSLGEGQVVAVVDTGLDYTHPDIAHNVFVNPGEDLNGNGRVDDSDWNGLDDDGNGFTDDLRGYDFVGFGDPLPEGGTAIGDPDPYDEIGHGTHVAGTIAAQANNGIGIAGVAPAARILPLKGFDADGRGRDSDLWRAVLYALENGADVINASWSCSPACPENPLAREILGVAESLGVPFVTSAGNSGFDVSRNDPERSRLAITVGSLGFDDALSAFSNRGWLLDLLAPGGGPSTGPVFAARRNILSLAAAQLPATEEPFRIAEDYYRLAGTSMAAPHVSGAIALLRALRPGLSPSEIRRLLRISTRDLGPLGHDPGSGGGALDLPRLLTAALPDLELAFDEPDGGFLFDPNLGPIAIPIRAEGEDAIRFSLARSRGLQTDVFEPIAEWIGDGRQSVDWSAAELEDGPQVLRLRAELKTNAVVDEFAIVSLERTRPVRLSRGEFHELQPSIEGRRVVWQAQTESEPRRGQIRVGGFGVDPRDRATAPEKRNEGIRPGDRETAHLRTQSRPPLSAIEPVALFPLDDSLRTHVEPIADRRGVVWRMLDPETQSEELRGCRWARWRPGWGCSTETLVRSRERLDPFGFAAGRVVWSVRSAQFDVFGCLWKRRGDCRATRLDAAVGEGVSTRLLDFDGETALWKLNSAGAPLGFCHPVLRGADCVPRRVVDSFGLAPLAESAAISGNLLAFEVFLPSGSQIAYCALDLETGECDVALVPNILDGRNPQVSGRRIVWTESRPGEEASIGYCEFEFATSECPRQRLTGTAAPAGDAAIDGHRVVWRDERIGPQQIFGLTLPEIGLPARVEARAGRLRWIPIDRLDDSGDSLEIVVEGLEGPTPEQFDAELWKGARGRSWLRFRPTKGKAVREPTMNTATIALWRIRAIAESGLESRRTLSIEVDPGFVAKP